MPSPVDVPDRPDPALGLASVHQAVADACARARRDPSSVTVVAASKTVPAVNIMSAIAAGQTVFGENRVQEARAKWPLVRERFPAVELHLIGPLQTNKVRSALRLFDAIHSVDRTDLCVALARESSRAGRRPTLFVQVNTGEEPQKAGVPPAQADRFIAACQDDHGLNVAGLMCIPPNGEPATPHFDMLARIAARHGLKLLSMGMSMDFSLAIEHGATHVRVGRRIFGAA